MSPKIIGRLSNLLSLQSCQRTKMIANVLYAVSKCISVTSILRMSTSGKLQNHKPKDKNSKSWYIKGHLGKAPLGGFVGNLCDKIGTKKRYTNYCVCVTNASLVISTGKYTDKEMMEMIGHKSVQGLTVSQRVKNNKKIEMAKSLNLALKHTDNQIDDMVKKENLPPMVTPKSTPTLAPSTSILLQENAIIIP